MTADEQTALVVVVPEAEPLVSKIRARFDRSALRGMPAHVTVLYPDEGDAFRCGSSGRRGLTCRVCSCVALAAGVMGMLFACLAPGLPERGEYLHEPTGIVFPDPHRLKATRSRGPSELYDPPANFVAYSVVGGPNVAFRLRPVGSEAASAQERLRDETRRSAEQQQHSGWSVLPDAETTIELLGEAREARQFSLLPPASSELDDGSST